MEQPLVNHWWQILVLSHPVLEETLFWRLQSFGCQGMATEIRDREVLTSAYLPLEKASQLDLAALGQWIEQDALMAGYPLPAVSWSMLPEEDWASSWKAHWQPQEVGDQLVIFPAWVEVPMGLTRKVIRLDPGSAFGTGAHATTHLCLEALEMRFAFTLPDDFLFADLGCGSGILGIGAYRLGATAVYAVDIDSLAIKATQHNWGLNALPPDRLFVQEGDLAALIQRIPRPVDGFACNILASTIVEMIPHFGQLLAPQGWGILSGILMEQSGEVIKVLESYGWTVATVWQTDNWACLTIRKT